MKALAITLWGSATLLASEAWAAGAKHGAAEKSAGLPQFDPSSFASQVFWLAIAFAILYIFFSKKTLPEISSVIESRKEHIQSDLTSAEELKAEAEGVQEAYETILEEARQKSSTSFAKAEAKIKEKTNEVYQDFQARSAKEITAKEKAIEKAKADAMDEMNVLAAEIAREAAEKIIGVETDLKQAKTVVKSLHTSRAKAA